VKALGTKFFWNIMLRFVIVLCGTRVLLMRGRVKNWGKKSKGGKKGAAGDFEWLQYGHALIHSKFE